MDNPIFDSQTDDERAAAAEKERKLAEYMRGPHPKRWARRARLEREKFHQSVAETKPIFDTISMALTSAAIWGAATYIFLSGPIDPETCARNPLLAIPAFLLAGWTSLLALSPLIHLVRYQSALQPNDVMKPYKMTGPNKRAPERGMPVVALAVTFMALFLVSGVFAGQIIARAPEQSCAASQP